MTGGNSGTVLLQTTDLKTFTSPVPGYATQVMTAPVALRSCNPAYGTAFDGNYAAAGSVVQDPTLPPGNLIMIYEAENHCPGGMQNVPYYATVGFARSSDNGRSWPPPANLEFGTAGRYPVLKPSTPEPSEPGSLSIGTAIPSAFVDGNYLYVTYVSLPAPPAVWDGKIRMARASARRRRSDQLLEVEQWGIQPARNRRQRHRRPAHRRLRRRGQTQDMSSIYRCRSARCLLADLPVQGRSAGPGCLVLLDSDQPRTPGLERSDIGPGFAVAASRSVS